MKWVTSDLGELAKETGTIKGVLNYSYFTFSLIADHNRAALSLAWAAARQGDRGDCFSPVLPLRCGLFRTLQSLKWASLSWSGPSSNP